MAIVFRQKEFGPSSFSNLDDFVTGSNNDYSYLTLAPLNIMKSIEMWGYINTHGKSFVPHWINDMVVKEIMLKLIKCGIPPQVAFAPFESDDKIVRDVFGSKLTDEVIIPDFGIGQSFYEETKIRFLNEKKNSSESSDPKYSNWLKDNPMYRTSDEYLIIYKYLALCLSGQLDPSIDDDINSSSCSRKIRTTKVNYSKIAFKSQKKITEIIIKCLSNISYHLPIEIAEGLKVLNYKS